MASSFKHLFSVKQDLSLIIGNMITSKIQQRIYFDIQHSALYISVPITTKVVSSNPVHGEVFLIQLYVIKFVSDLQQVGGFLRFPQPIKLITTI